MHWRFFKRIQLSRFVKLNLSKNGFSVTLGTKGLGITIGHRGITKTLGIPGSGLYFTGTTKLDERSESFFKYPWIKDQSPLSSPVETDDKAFIEKLRQLDNGSSKK